MAQLNSPLQPRTDDKETKKGSIWISIIVFCLALSWPVGVILAVVAAVIVVIGHFVKIGGQAEPKKTSAKKHRSVHKKDPGRRIDQPPVQQHVHGSLTDHCRAKRLEQLETLKEAGLYSEEEYKAKKRQIIRETAKEK